MRIDRTTAALAAIALSAALSLVPAQTALAVAPAPAAAPAAAAQAAAVAVPSLVIPKAKTFKNCTQLNKTYKHGVGKKGAKDKVSRTSKPVRNFKVSTAIYNANRHSDRDKDGIACEKR